MVSIVLELLSDKNPNIRILVNAILDYVQVHDEMWRQEIKARRFQVHNQVYIKLMEDFDKQMGVGVGGEDGGMYDDMYYYDEGGKAGYPGQHEGAAGMMGQDEEEEFDSDDALFFDNNDLANRIWEDGD